MRNLLILILVVAALALLRWLVRDVARAVMGVLRGAGSEQKAAAGQSEANPLVKDPLSGTYIDERIAIKDVIDGETIFFESKENRDTYRRQRSSG